jgi:hypothetical protein
MGLALWIGVWSFVALFVLFGARMQYLQLRLERYLRESHPDEWDRFFGGDRNEMFLWPFMKDTPGVFFRSEEDFGDRKVANLRRQIKRAANLTGLSGLGTFLWGMLLGVVLPMALSR